MARPRHYRISALPGQEPVTSAGLPSLLLPPVDAHRRLRGPYTAAGTIMRALVPGALERVPALVAAHDIEILTAAPELRHVMTLREDVLPALDTLDENTRFLPGTRTIRTAHGLAEFIGGYQAATGGPPAALVLRNVDAADPTDAEFISVLLRRIDPARLLLVVSGPSLPEDGGLGQALATHADPAPARGAAVRPDRRRVGQRVAAGGRLRGGRLPQR